MYVAMRRGAHGDAHTGTCTKNVPLTVGCKLHFICSSDHRKVRDSRRAAQRDKIWLTLLVMWLEHYESSRSSQLSGRFCLLPPVSAGTGSSGSSLVIMLRTCACSSCARAAGKSKR